MMDTRLGRNRRPLNTRDTRTTRDDAEFNLLLIGMAWDPRIGQAQPRFGPLLILKYDGFIGDAAVAGSALQRAPECVGRCHDVIQQSEISTIELFGETKAKEILVERLGGGFKKSDLIGASMRRSGSSI